MSQSTSKSQSLSCDLNLGQGCVVYTFLKENQQPLQIKLHEIYSAHYALYTWPSAPVLAQFVWYNNYLFRGKTVLEIGCGTALSGLVAAKIGASAILADKFTPESQSLLIKNVTQNDCHTVQNISRDSSRDSNPCVQIVPLIWGDISSDIRSLPQLDFVLASDCFYDDNDFEDIIATISFLLKEKGHANSCFFTTYQLRNSDWNLNCLMHQYELEGHAVPLEEFEADSQQLLGSKLPGRHTISLFKIKLKSSE